MQQSVHQNFATRYFITERPDLAKFDHLVKILAIPKVLLSIWQKLTYFGTLCTLLDKILSV